MKAGRKDEGKETYTTVDKKGCVKFTSTLLMKYHKISNKY